MKACVRHKIRCIHLYTNSIPINLLINLTPKSSSNIPLPTLTNNQVLAKTIKTPIKYHHQLYNKNTPYPLENKSIAHKNKQNPSRTLPTLIEPSPSSVAVKTCLLVLKSLNCSTYPNRFNIYSKRIKIDRNKYGRPLQQSNSSLNYLNSENSTFTSNILCLSYYFNESVM